MINSNDSYKGSNKAQNNNYFLFHMDNLLCQLLVMLPDLLFKEMKVKAFSCSQQPESHTQNLQLLQIELRRP